MKRADLNYPLSAVLIGVLVLVTITGLIEATLDINHFIWHKYSAYIFVALAAVHVYLSYKTLMAYFTKRLHRLRYGVSRRVRPSSTEAAMLHQKGRFGFLFSRRGFFRLALGSTAGFILGQRLPLSDSPALASGMDIGQVYHQWSKPSYLGALTRALDWGTQPEMYKIYPDAPLVPLSRDFTYRGLTVEEAIQRRRSSRDYSGQPMSLAELSHLLYHINGITEDTRYPFRAAPSSGGLYPIEIYPVVHNVADLSAGLYHYNVRDHALDLLRAEDFRRELTHYAVDQEMVGQANLTLVLTAIFQREQWKYGSRAYRYTLLDAGHIGQNIYLAATSMGLGACAIGAFFDDDINQMLGVDGVAEAVVYLLVVGKV